MPSDPRKLVTLSLIVTAVLVTVDEIASGRLPRPRIYIGLIAVFIVLLLLAQIAPVIAAPLAMLILVVALLQRGPNVLRKVTK
jgi:hypothetical protein